MPAMPDPNPIYIGTYNGAVVYFSDIVILGGLGFEREDGWGPCPYLRMGLTASPGTGMIRLLGPRQTAPHIGIGADADLPAGWEPGKIHASQGNEATHLRLELGGHRTRVKEPLKIGGHRTRVKEPLRIGGHRG
jgi:hypothetical protein